MSLNAEVDGQLSAESTKTLFKEESGGWSLLEDPPPKVPLPVGYNLSAPTLPTSLVEPELCFAFWILLMDCSLGRMGVQPVMPQGPCVL